MAFLDGLSKIVKTAGDLTKRGGKAIEDAGDYLAQPENQERIRKQVNDAKETVVNTAQSIFNKGGKQNTQAPEDEDIVVDYPEERKDVTPEAEAVDVEILEPAQSSAKDEF